MKKGAEKKKKKKRRRWRMKRRWEKEGAKVLADGGESLRRVARRSYRRYHGGSPPRSRFPHLPLSLPRASHSSSYTYVTTLGTRSRALRCIPVTPSYTLRRNNVTLSLLVPGSGSLLKLISFISLLCSSGNIDLWILSSATRGERRGSFVVRTIGRL